jgi:hypothetical protein
MNVVITPITLDDWERFNAFKRSMPVTTEEFVAMTNIDLIRLFFLLEEKKLRTEKINKHLHIDISDERARQYMPDYKPMKDLF